MPSLHYAETDRCSTGSAAPEPLSVVSANIPATLRAIPNWVCWKYLQRSGRWIKLPCQPNRIAASVNDRVTWSEFTAVMAAYRSGGFAGVGFVLDGCPVTDDGLVIAGVDLDKVDVSKEVERRAADIVRGFDAYTELSPSGRGLRIFCLARPLATGVSHDGVELYTSGRYLTVTGHVVDGLDV